MQLKEGIFAVKLCELEKEYGLLQSTISICQERDRIKFAVNWKRLRMIFTPNTVCWSCPLKTAVFPLFPLWQKLSWNMAERRRSCSGELCAGI